MHGLGRIPELCILGLQAADPTSCESSIECSEERQCELTHLRRRVSVFMVPTRVAGIEVHNWYEASVSSRLCVNNWENKMDLFVKGVLDTCVDRGNISAFCHIEMHWV